MSDEPASLTPDRDPKPIIGSISFAEKIERRQFLRRGATSLFLGFTAVASGSAGLLGFLADPAAAAGPCCPSCCGPSPCCNTGCCTKSCCSLGDDICQSNSQCSGKDNRFYGGAGCWS